MVKKLVVMIFALALPVIALSTTALAWNYSPTLLRQGMQNDGVLSMQKDLYALGYLDREPTGYFGSLTLQSVIHFQTDHWLSADGIVGPQTGEAIKAEKIFQTGKQYLGVPYQWGGTTPSGFDCSGFTQYVFARNGINIPRSAATQYDAGIPVAKSQLKPGNLVFFTTYKAGPSHVGIYVGNGRFIQASSSQGVTITDLNNPYYAARYIGARDMMP